MNRYFDLTEDQKLALSNDELLTAVKLEGVHRGIKPPITLDAALVAAGYKGFTLPTDAAVFFEIMCPEQHCGHKRTGIAFRSGEAARAALKDAVAVIETGYSSTRKNQVIDPDFTVVETIVSLSPNQQFATKLEELEQDNTDFNKLAEECSANLSEIRQARYNKAVRTQKRAQYLELAQGNEDIAKSFWAKTEGNEWPTE